MINNALFAQDVIILKSGEEFPVKIYSTKGKMITYNKWDDQAREPLKLNKRHVQRYIMEYMKYGRISCSFSLGGLPFGTSTSLKRYMKDNGYDGAASGWLGTIDYPVSNVSPSFLLELEFLAKPPHGLSIEYAHANTGNVKGLGTPRIYYSNQQFAASYKFYMKDFRSNLQTGLIMNFSSIKDSDLEQSDFSWGFLIGYAAPLVEKQDFFLRFQTQFRYVLPIKIKNDDMFLTGEKVALSHLFIGLQTGIKIYTGKN